MSRLVAPSLLAADFTNLSRDVEMINQSEADWIHLDVMDGVFVPNISFGIPVIKAVKKVAKKPLDVHLMIVEPERYIRKFYDAGANHLTVHVEACRHLRRAIDEIKQLGMKAGITLNPITPVSQIEKIIPYVDIVLIMSVNPGFGGQEFIPSSLEKIKKVRNIIVKTGAHALIEVDGGIDLTNAGSLYNAGVDILVTGTTVFRADDPLQTISQLKKAV